jgi:hypothetical protein
MSSERSLGTVGFIFELLKERWARKPHSKKEKGCEGRYSQRGRVDRLCQVLNARGDITGEAADRLRQVSQLFGVEADPSVAPEAKVSRKARA